MSKSGGRWLAARDSLGEGGLIEETQFVNDVMEERDLDVLGRMVRSDRDDRGRLNSPSVMKAARKCGFATSNAVSL